MNPDYLRHRDYARDYLGMDDQEADRYARHKTSPPAAEPNIPGQLELPTPGQPPRGQLGREHDDWGGF